MQAGWLAEPRPEAVCRSRQHPRRSPEAPTVAHVRLRNAEAVVRLALQRGSWLSVNREWARRERGMVRLSSVP
jgi:hypothetical protein